MKGGIVSDGKRQVNPIKGSPPRENADNKGPAYTYTPDGKLARRTWARGVTTAYGYTTAGELASVDYSDATPDVTYTHDRLGRPVTMTDALGVSTNVYDASTLALAEERWLGGVSLVRTTDAFGRPSGFALGQDYAVTYGYDTAGRFGSVTANVNATTNVVTYGYIQGSDLLAGWSSNVGMSFQRTFEPNRDLIGSVTNAWNGAAVSSFAYTNDEIGRRTARVDSGLTQNSFGYNMRSEVIEAIMGTNTYGYEFDPIGNRLTTTNNTASVSYTANELNQYTNVVNGATVTPVYDDDGNMTEYGPWTFTWDGENRLIVVASNSTPVSTNVYDHMSRRRAKTASDATHEYTYDGWNLIREQTASGGSSSTNYYVWGLDLSQSLQGAGGVGGLLTVMRDGTAYYPAYDANGNATEYVNDVGTTLAQYTYDPFGNTSAQSGPLADIFAHRFSTKYCDDEMGLYYYGYRYYWPELGRWLNRDPIGEEGGCNLFSAQFNNPVNNLDYLGLAVSVGSIDLDSILRALRSRPIDQRPTNECIRRIVELWRQHLVDQDSRLRGGNEGTDLLRRIYAELASNPNVQVVVQLGVIGDRGAASVRDYRDGRSRTILITLDMQLPDKCCEYPGSVVKQWNNIGVTFAHEMVHAYAAVLHRGHIQDRHTARQLQQRVSRWGNIEQDLLDDVRIPITEARRRFGAYIPDHAVIWFNHPVGGDMTSVMRALGYMLWGRYDEELSPALAPFIRNGENNQ